MEAVQSLCSASGLDWASFGGRQDKAVYCDRINRTPSNVSAVQTLELGHSPSGIEEIFLSEKFVADVPSIDVFISQLQTNRKTKSFTCSLHLHTRIAHFGLETHEVLGNHLVPLFVDCGNVPVAHQIFHRLATWNEHSWAALIQGYVDSGKIHCAFDLFGKMQEENASPRLHSYVCLLKACATIKALSKGQEIHMEVAKAELDNDPFVSNILLDLYAKCGLFDEARDVFETMPVQSVMPWTALISGYTEHGQYEEALICWKEMQEEGILPDRVTFVCVLKACAGMRALHKGQEVHSMIAVEGLENNVYVANALLGLYAKCAFFLDAQALLDDLSVQDVISWTELIVGYSEYGSCERALSALERMQANGVLADAVAFFESNVGNKFGAFFESGLDSYHADACVVKHL